MNTPNQTSHTEVDHPTSNAMEQAALLKARCAIARWQCCDHLCISDGEVGARAEWYAALEQRMHDWIGRGGLQQEVGGSEAANSERFFVD